MPPAYAEKPKPMEARRHDTLPNQGIGVPARSLFDRGETSRQDSGLGVPAPESKSTGTLKGEVDDDADFVKKVEREFVGNVDDLLKQVRSMGKGTQYYVPMNAQS